MSKTFKLNRPKYVEADMRVNKPVSNEKYLVNLTGNPNSRLIKIEKQRVRCRIDSGATTSLISWKFYNNLIFKVSKVAKIRNRYNQVPHLTQDTNGKVTNSQKTPQTRAKRSALSQQVTTKHI